MAGSGGRRGTVNPLFTKLKVFFFYTDTIHIFILARSLALNGIKTLS